MKRTSCSHAIARMKLCCLAGLLLAAQAARAVEPEVRLSFKFIVNSSGNRPATGNINTEAEINNQITRANQILASYISELRFRNVEVLDVSGQSGFYLADADEGDRDLIRAAAIANPGVFHWRNNAVNVYITGSSDTAISKFPPNNDIIILCQGIFDTTLAHEVGHSLNLIHTHDGDDCGDTLPDDPDWNRDQISVNAYAKLYSQLNASQKAAVDRTWGNLMSYHDPDNRSVLTPCQMDRMSAQAYSDRSWLLTRIPTYVRAGAPNVPLFDMGSWAFPYPTIQDAIDGGEVNHRVLVLLKGNHAAPASALTTSTGMVTRRGTSKIYDLKPAYQLPYNVEDSGNAAVRAAVVRAQGLDKQGDSEAALAALKEAASAATGREQEAIELEIGQRLEAMQRFVEAGQHFKKVAEKADQPGLRIKVLRKADVMQVKEQKRLQRLQQTTPTSATNMNDQP